jgi:hypothetical protein
MSDRDCVQRLRTVHHENHQLSSFPNIMHNKQQQQAPAMVR